MSIELPGELVWVMNLLGLNWPDVDEDELRAWAGHVREFAAGLQGAHDDTHAMVQGLAASYQGASYEALVDRWSRASAEHHTVLIDCCGVLATGLELAADGIVVAKGAVIAELVAMAAEFAAEQAAAVATLGLAEAANVVIVEAGKRVVNAILQQIEQEIIGQLVSMAIEPFQAEIEKAVGGLVFDGVEKALGGAA
ncbi:hypothetical protein CFP65_3844 [Kitasatospora sp. MMS16-BH015]|uniref:WXG100 family type VII secretion target n=1 Tax=Kitasatospora sp. MMS16-BH015 TaxID=2018025 RepID=UPI000CA15F18|nr:WXG100 family type VII secretion target [Kitasatospora sp. MMS16-BH015]AUG78624.1 hypothetical protein CFP65_3844 [Kitasatospora sp. MMS16-BH015]